MQASFVVKLPFCLPPSPPPLFFLMDEAFFSFHVLATASQPEQTAAAALRAGRASPARQPAEGSGPGAARSGGTGPSRQPGQLRGPEPPAPSSLRLRQRRRSRAPRKGSGPPTPAAGPPPGVPARLCRGRPPSAAPCRDPGAAALGRPLGSLRFISLGWEQILAFPSGQRLAGGGGREGGGSCEFLLTARSGPPRPRSSCTAVTDGVNRV